MVLFFSYSSIHAADALLTNLHVLVGSEPSAGLRESDFNSQLLQAVESKLRAIQERKTKEQFQRDNINRTPVFRSNSVFIMPSERRLMVVKIWGEGVHTVYILGIMKDELVRVQCFQANVDSIPIASGKCGEQISKTFNVKLLPY